MANSLPKKSLRSSLSVLYAIRYLLPSSAIGSFLRTRDERRAKGIRLPVQAATPALSEDLFE
jgi:hypothetical protein